jgi:hypothetical protein
MRDEHHKWNKQNVKKKIRLRIRMAIIFLAEPNSKTDTAQQTYMWIERDSNGF